MTKERASVLYPDLPVFTDWKKVGNLKTKTALKKEGKWVDGLKPAGVFASRRSKDALYLLYIDYYEPEPKL